MLFIIRRCHLNCFVLRLQAVPDWGWWSCAEQCVLFYRCTRWNLAPNDLTCRLLERVDGETVVDTVGVKYVQYEGGRDEQCVVPCTRAGTWLASNPDLTPAERCKPCRTNK